MTRCCLASVFVLAIALMFSEGPSLRGIVLVASRIVHILEGITNSLRLMFASLCDNGERRMKQVDLRTCYSNMMVKDCLWDMLSDDLLSREAVAADTIQEIYADSQLPWEQRQAIVRESFLEKTKDWTRPVLIRGLMEDAAPSLFWRTLIGDGIGHEASSSDVMKTFREVGSHVVSMLDFENITTHWDVVRNCPAARRESLVNIPFSEAIKIINENTYEAYVAFNTGILVAINKTDGGSQNGYAWDHRLLNFCGSFGGYSSEVFVGTGTQVGAPLHHAFMNNLFMQMHGARNITLVSPRYSQLLRPSQSAGYSTAYKAHKDWGRREWDDFFTRIPRLEATMYPGDVLLIPAWWWHAVRNAGSGAMAALSHRGNNFRSLSAWKHWPVIRAFYSDGPADVLVNDLSQTVWFWLSGAERDVFAVQAMQHRKHMN